ncbi:MAG: uroporphyrinogen decarboxylase, partial [Devosiaceae bacterium]|nr:uroporphyrinogen decarboxylase [Devosiaceae bacterium MH13]
FLDLCYNPELATEVTLQPIRRFGFDGSILFSDILVVPHALGQDVRFEEGVGPILPPLSPEEIEALVDRFDGDPSSFDAHLNPVIETVQRLREALPNEVTLLGFCGAPWTVANYMVAGRGSPDQAAARLFALEHPAIFARLLDCLARASARYLNRQIAAGADAVQVFDSWAGSLSPAGLSAYSDGPIRAIRQAVGDAHPNVPVIGFAKGAMHRLGAFADATGVDAVGLDWTISVGDARSQLPVSVVSQGNIDPLLMVAGGDALDAAVDAMLAQAEGVPHVANLGHGITPQGSIDHVHRFIARVRGEA